MDSGKASNPKTSSNRAAELRRTASLMRRVLLGFKAHLDNDLRSKNVTTAQLRLLREIKEHPGSSGAQMARACYVTPQSAQAMLVRAVRAGWITRTHSAENDRLLIARLTPAGERLLAYADGVLAQLEAHVWSSATLEDLRAMNRTLERGLLHLGD